MTLGVNANRVVTIVFQVISQSVHTFMVNLAAQIIAHEHTEAPPGSDNKALEAIFRHLYNDIIARRPEDAEIAGIVFSLGGVFDRTTNRWIHTSRWPRMHNLDISAVFPKESDSITLSRTLDNELLIHLLQQDESTLLLHWGYGVGFAFGQSGDNIVEGGYAFGEIGHWHISGQMHLATVDKKGVWKRLQRCGQSDTKCSEKSFRRVMMKRILLLFWHQRIWQITQQYSKRLIR